MDRNRRRSLEFERSVKAAIQESSWALPGELVSLPGKPLNSPDAFGLQKGNLLVVLVEPMAPLEEGGPDSLAERLKILGQARERLLLLARWFKDAPEVDYLRTLPPPPRAVWAVLVCEEKARGPELQPAVEKGLGDLGIMNLQAFRGWLGVPLASSRHIIQWSTAPYAGKPDGPPRT